MASTCCWTVYHSHGPQAVEVPSQNISSMKCPPPTKGVSRAFGVQRTVGEERQDSTVKDGWEDRKPQEGQVRPNAAYSSHHIGCHDPRCLPALWTLDFEEQAVAPNQQMQPKRAYCETTKKAAAPTHLVRNIQASKLRSIHRDHAGQEVTEQWQEAETSPLSTLHPEKRKLALEKEIHLNCHKVFSLEEACQHFGCCPGCWIDISLSACRTTQGLAYASCF